MNNKIFGLLILLIIGIIQISIYLIFKNPNLRYRSEDFGGIAKIKFKTFIINKKQYQLSIDFRCRTLV